MQSLRPAPVRVGPRQIWYRAGFLAGRRRANTWRAIAAVTCVAMSAALAGLLLDWPRRMQLRVPERVVYVPSGPASASVPVALATTSDSSPSMAQAGWHAYQRLCDEMLEDDGRASRPVAGSGPAMGESGRLGDLNLNFTSPPDRLP